MAQSILGDDTKAAQLAQLLQTLQDPDNHTRSEAEQTLNTAWLDAQPDALLAGLAEQIQRNQNAATRTFAALLFRRMAKKSKTMKTEDGENVGTELFRACTHQTKEFTKMKLLECLQQEQNNNVRDKIGDAVAEIARQYSELDTIWEQLLYTLDQLARSPDPGQRSAAFRVFATTPEIIQEEHEQKMMEVFKTGFSDSHSNVQLAAMEAFASFFENLNKSAQKKYYYLLPTVLAILVPIRNSGDEDNLTRALLAVIILAEFAPKMFKDSFRDLVKFSIPVIADKDMGDTVRQNALELMATFADNTPALCKKDPEYTNQMVMQCLQLMADVGAGDEDCEIWKTQEDLDTDESDANHVAGEQTLDRLANKLGGSALLAPAFGCIEQMLNTNDWQQQHAALMAISAISEGCREIMEEKLDSILNLIMPCLQNKHPRVRWAGCNALGQMSTDFAGTMQEKYADLVVPQLTQVLDAPEPRVKSHAAAALVNFCEEAESDTLRPYLGDLLNRLHALLQRNERYVQEQALSTIATIADSAETAFATYYDDLMPLMISALRAPQEKESRLLKSKAMECATLIALAVGREKMGPDAITMMQVLDNIQNSITEEDDPQHNYLLHSWGRMCRIMGADFMPYLPNVMPPLMTLASASADIQMIEDENEAAKYEADEGYELVPLKGKFIRINTAVMDDKHTAIELISVYAQNLGAHFAQYVLHLMDEVILKSLTFFFHDSVRAAAAAAIPKLLNSFKQANGLQNPQMIELWRRTVEKILEALQEEPQVENLSEIFECFYECVEVMGEGCLDENHMKSFIQAAEHALTEYKIRVHERAEERGDKPATNGADAEWQDDDEDSEEVQLAIEDDQAMLSEMNKAFRNVTKYQKTSFIPHWSKLLTFYKEFAEDASDPTMRQWALCIYDDALEYWPADHSQQFMQDYIRPALDDGLKDQDPANRQAACYGIGVAALRSEGTTVWPAYAASCLPTLFACTEGDIARTEDHIYATENACAAIAKILVHCPRCGVNIDNAQAIAEAWLGTLPVVNDEEAAPWAYGYLSELVDANFPPCFAKAPKLVKDIAEALQASMLASGVRSRAETSLRKLYNAAQQGPMQQDMTGVIMGLDEKTKKMTGDIVAQR